MAATRLSLQEACAELSKVLPVNLQLLDRNTHIAVLGDVADIYGRADAGAQAALNQLMRFVSNLADGYNPPYTRKYYPEVLRTAQSDCRRAGAKLVPSRATA
jgi:hypothetical protein